jgi:plasmid stabilization system protein ParE
MALFRIRPFAWREINAHLAYLEEEAGLETTGRFLDRLMSSFLALAGMPRKGILLRLSQIAALGSQEVRELANFYLGTREGVDIVHLVHGARDVEALLNR